MVKAKLYRQNDTEAYTYTLTIGEKGEKKYIIAPKVHLLNLG